MKTIRQLQIPRAVRLCAAPLSVSVSVVSAWPGLNTTKAATADTVLAWGNLSAQVPAEAQSGVIANATKGPHTIAQRPESEFLSAQLETNV